MKHTTIIFLILFLSLLVSNVLFAMQYMAIQKELQNTQAALKVQNINEKTLAFTKLFIEEVLQSETEVGFETRLQLENAVRNIGDEQILSQWQKFTQSKTEAEAQGEVKNLLRLLVEKIAG